MNNNGWPGQKAKWISSPSCSDFCVVTNSHPHQDFKQPIHPPLLFIVRVLRSSSHPSPILPFSHYLLPSHLFILSTSTKVSFVFQRNLLRLSIYPQNKTLYRIQSQSWVSQTLTDLLLTLFVFLLYVFYSPLRTKLKTQTRNLTLKSSKINTNLSISRPMLHSNPTPVTPELLCTFYRVGTLVSVCWWSI